jgi:hypothetical protein
MKTFLRKISTGCHSHQIAYPNYILELMPSRMDHNNNNKNMSEDFCETKEVTKSEN